MSIRTESKGSNGKLIETTLLASGFLTEYALLQSMGHSKTLTWMVIVGLSMFGGFVLFLLNMAGAI